MIVVDGYRAKDGSRRANGRISIGLWATVGWGGRWIAFL